MKVCIVDPSLFTLPYDQHLCAGLSAIGVEATLCGRVLRPGERVHLPGVALEPRCYPRTERGGPSRTRGLRPWMKALEHASTFPRVVDWLRDNFDVAHFQWSPMPLFDHGLWRRLARDRTVIFTVHDTTPFLNRPTSRLQRLGWSRLLDAAHGLVVHTEESRRVLEARGIARERIAVIPHGPLHAAAPESTRASAAEHDRSRPLTLLAFGEIKPYKGLDVLLRAAALLPRALSPRWRILVAGRPRCDLAPLQALAAQSHIRVDWRAEFIPEAEVPALWEQADLAVFPYRCADASGVLMLALPYAVPVVASAIGLFREMLQDGATALLTAPGDEAALAVALARVMGNDELRATLRSNLRQLALRQPTWADIARTHVDFYRRIALGVAAGRSGPRPAGAAAKPAIPSQEPART